MFAPIARIVLYVKNVDRMAEFYQRVFEMKPVARPEKGWLELGGGGCNLALHQAAKTANFRRAAAKITFGVKDVAKARAILARRGLKLGPIHTTPNSTFCNGKDPEGNLLSIGNRGVV
jgi:catechol 2,3-dioxygenase-like lactoylglutathione lyase family enzyme